MTNRPPDFDVRDRVISSPLVSTLLEAGAGSGKTETMVRRLVQAVEQGVDLREIVAVTFTRKAAGEMRERFQRRLIESENPTVQSAATRISEARIGTIDSLVQQIIEDHGLRAGLPTAFRVVDDSFLNSQLRLAIEKEIPGWLAEPELEAAWVALGEGHDRYSAQVNRLTKIASIVAKNPDASIPVAEWDSFLGNWLTELDAIEAMPLDPKLADVVLPALERTRTQVREGLYGDINFPPMKTLGNMAHRHEIKRIFSLFTEGWRYPILYPLVSRAANAGRATAATLRRQGLLTFDSALAVAADLMTIPEIRQQMAQETRILMVDEMQDTSPDQLALLLNFMEAGVAVFTVGDPKQAIYRFRGADLKAYRDLRDQAERIGLQLESLFANFRSSPVVLDFVTQVTDRHLGWADYQPMFPTQEESDIDAAFVFGGYAEPGEKHGRREMEQAAAIAAAMPEPLSGAGTAILVASRTNLNELLDCLRLRGIPCRVEGSRNLVESPEVAGIIAILRACVSATAPEKRFWRAAALRSPAFGCQESDLPEAIERYAPLDALLEQIQGASASDAIQTIIDLTGIESAAIYAARPAQSWNRLHWLRAGALQLSVDGRDEIADLLQAISDGEIGDGAEAPVPEEDENALRIMTVHASKGLEFPAVIACGFGASRRFTSPEWFIDGDELLLKLGPGAAAPGYADLEAVARIEEKHERDRLIYVAMTRAENLVALSGWRRSKQKPAAGDLCQDLSQLQQEIDETFAPIEEFVRPQLNQDETCLDAIKTVDFVEPRTTPTRLARESLVSGGSQTADDFDRDEPQESEIQADDPGTVPSFPASKAGTAFGLAVHRVLEQSDLTRISPSDADAIAAALRVSGEEVLRFANAALSTEPIRRASVAVEKLREAYLGIQRDGVLLEGILDLVFRNADGTVEVVDYKTDRVADSVAAEAKMQAGYREQGLAYAELVESALGQRPAHVWFIFVRADPVAVIDALA
jgi:ATP-dependent helicase/nuclease subunit A